MSKKLQASHASVTANVRERRTRLHWAERSESDAAHKGQMDSHNKSELLKTFCMVKCRVLSQRMNEFVICTKDTSGQDTDCVLKPQSFKPWTMWHVWGQKFCQGSETSCGILEFIPFCSKTQIVVVIMWKGEPKCVTHRTLCYSLVRSNGL